MKHWLCLLLLAPTFAAPAVGEGAQAIGCRPSAVGPTADGRWPMADGLQRETHRIRVGNHQGGAVEVSLDGGRNWVTIGRVIRPATDTGAGFAALAAAPPGAVAALSLDGITVRTDHASAHLASTRAIKPRIFRLLPAGSVAGAADILLDVKRGHGIFGPLAPPLGSELLLENANGTPRPLPGGYVPQVGDHLIIVATAPADAPAMLVFENREGGRVLSVSPTGDEIVVGHVRRPLRGVGRYPATEGAPCGGVVLHHPAALVVATTPAGSAEPGGFLIQPEAAIRASGVQAFRRSGVQAGIDRTDRSGPNARTPERLNAAAPADGSVLIVDRLTPSGPAFRVPIVLSPVSGSLVGETRVEARLDGGPWEPLPAVGGAAPDALTAAALSKQFAALGTPRHLAEGVTQLRLVLAPPTPERLRAALAQAAGEGSVHMASVPTRIPPARAAAPVRAHHGGRSITAVKGARKGTLRIVANIQGRGIVYVMFYVDGHIRKLTNTPPFEWTWDTRTSPNGLHSLEIRGADADGRILTSQTQHVIVVN